MAGVDEDKQVALARKTQEEGWSVRTLETESGEVSAKKPKAAKEAKPAKKAAPEDPNQVAFLRSLEQRLGKATIVSIGHRSTLAAFHRRRLSFTRDGDRYALRESSLTPA